MLFIYFWNLSLLLKISCIVTKKRLLASLLINCRLIFEGIEIWRYFHLYYMFVIDFGLNSVHLQLFGGVLVVPPLIIFIVFSVSFSFEDSLIIDSYVFECAIIMTWHTELDII